MLLSIDISQLVNYSCILAFILNFWRVGLNVLNPDQELSANPWTNFFNFLIMSLPFTFAVSCPIFGVLYLLQSSYLLQAVAICGYNVYVFRRLHLYNSSPKGRNFKPSLFPFLNLFNNNLWI